MSESTHEKIERLQAENDRLRKIICQFGRDIIEPDYCLPLETIEAIVQIMAEDKEAGQ